MCIKWGKLNSMYFKVSNSVRQGGVLSPKLFAIYIDNLCQDLAMCKSGCYINEQCTNHVMYAADICLLAPSAIGLQRLLDVCFDFSISNDIWLIYCAYLAYLLRILNLKVWVSVPLTRLKELL